MLDVQNHAGKDGSEFSESFISYSTKEMEIRGSTIRQWAGQTEDRELAMLAKKVISAAQCTKGDEK